MEKEKVATPENTETLTKLQRDMQDLQRPRKGKWWAWPLTLLILGGGGYELYQTVGKQKATTGTTKSGKKGGNVPVVAIGARKGDIPVYLTGLGSVAAFNTVTVKSRVDGQVVKIAFKEGQLVHEGDLLAEIDPRPYQVQLLQAQGQLAKDQAMRKDALVNLDRYKRLWEEKVIPKQQYDTQGSMVGQFDGALTADEAAIESAKLSLTYCKITSPITGVLGLRLVDQGNIVHASDTTGMAVITQLQPISVLFTIPEDNLQPVLKSLRAGQHLPVQAFDRDFKVRLATGTLQTIDNTIDQSTGTSKLKATFDNNDNALFPNQFVNVRLLIETKRNSVIIPAAAVQRGPQGTFTYVVGEGKKAEIRPISVGTTEGNDVQIEKGLEVSELVIVDGADKLQDGSRMDVKVQDATGAIADMGGARGGDSGGKGDGGGRKKGGRGGKGKKVVAE
jgi:multidrug efflux system membrane fusion protein